MNRNLWKKFSVRIHSYRFSVSHRDRTCSVSQRSTQLISMAKPLLVRVPDRCELMHLSLEEENVLNKALEVAVNSLKSGNVIAVPTDTIYGITGLAQNNEAIQKMYNIKNRSCTKPVAISVGDIDDLYKWSKIVVSRKVLEDLLPGPVTIVSERSQELNPLLNPNTNLVGIRIPDHTFMRRLAQACGGPVALTSANRSAAQSSLTLDEFEYLWPHLDLLVDGGVLNDTDKARLGSTVVDLSEEGKFRIIREGSAYKRTVDILKNKHKMIEILIPY